METENKQERTFAALVVVSLTAGVLGGLILLLWWAAPTPPPNPLDLERFGPTAELRAPLPSMEDGGDRARTQRATVTGSREQER